MDGKFLEVTHRILKKKLVADVLMSVLLCSAILAEVEPVNLSCQLSSHSIISACSVQYENNTIKDIWLNSVVIIGYTRLYRMDFNYD